MFTRRENLPPMTERRTATSSSHQAMPARAWGAVQERPAPSWDSTVAWGPWEALKWEDLPIYIHEGWHLKTPGSLVDELCHACEELALARSEFLTTKKEYERSTAGTALAAHLYKKTQALDKEIHSLDEHIEELKDYLIKARMQ